MCIAPLQGTYNFAVVCRMFELCKGGCESVRTNRITRVCRYNDSGNTAIHKKRNDGRRFSCRKS